MIKRFATAAAAIALVAGVAFAGEPSADPQAAMMAEMSKCDVCSHMMPHMQSLGPVMSMESVHLDNGFAMVHMISDASKMDEFRAMNAEMNKAGESCLTMSDADAKTHLCSFCRDIRANVKAGATMSLGDTSNGCMMVLTSGDPAVQKSLSALATKCAMMAKHS